MGTISVTGVISPRNQRNDRGPYQVIFHTNCRWRDDRFLTRRLVTPNLWLQKSFFCRKATFKTKPCQKKHEVDSNNVKKSISRPLCVFFWWLISVGCFVFFGGFLDFLRGSPDIFPHGWQKSTCKGGILISDCQAVHPVIFDDPWVLVGYIWGHYICDTYIRQVYYFTLIYLRVCGKYSWRL